MKKYFLTMVVMAIFAIGFTASDEESSSSNSSSSTPQVEEKQETEADRQARERKEKEAKIKDMLEYAYKHGLDEGTNMTYPMEADKWYTGRYGTPSTDEDFENFEKFKKEYNRGVEDGRKARARMKNM